MKRGSIFYRLYREANAENPAKIRAVDDLLDKGYNGLAESIVAKYFQTRIGSRNEREGIKVNGNGASYFI